MTNSLFKRLTICIQCSEILLWNILCIISHTFLICNNTKYSKHKVFVAHIINTMGDKEMLEGGLVNTNCSLPYDWFFDFMASNALVPLSDLNPGTNFNDSRWNYRLRTSICIINDIPIHRNHEKWYRWNGNSTAERDT